MVEITPNLEKIILNFASYASMLGRSGYAEVLRETLLTPEPARSEQMDILKHSISEIFTITPDHSEFREFVGKYDLNAESIKELLRFLGPDSGLKYYAEDDTTEVFVTIPSFMKSKLDEKLYDRLTLLIKLNFGKSYWEEIEYSEMNVEKINKLLEKLYSKSPKLSEYIYSLLNG